MYNVINARPGNFVFESDESNEIIGFVSKVSTTAIYIMTWQPVEMPSNGTHIGATSEDVLEKVTEILIDADEEIRDSWRQLLY